MSAAGRRDANDSANAVRTTPPICLEIAVRIIRSLSLSFPRENATCLISDTAYQDLFPQWQAEVEICGKADVILLSLGNGDSTLVVWRVAVCENVASAV